MFPGHISDLFVPGAIMRSLQSVNLTNIYLCLSKYRLYANQTRQRNAETLHKIPAGSTQSKQNVHKWWFNVGPPSTKLDQHETSIGSASRWITFTFIGSRM